MTCYLIHFDDAQLAEDDPIFDRLFEIVDRYAHHYARVVPKGECSKPHNRYRDGVEFKLSKETENEFAFQLKHFQDEDACLGEIAQCLKNAGVCPQDTPVRRAGIGFIMNWDKR